MVMTTRRKLSLRLTILALTVTLCLSRNPFEVGKDVNRPPCRPSAPPLRFGAFRTQRLVRQSPMGYHAPETKTACRALRSLTPYLLQA